MISERAAEHIHWKQMRNGCEAWACPHVEGLGGGEHASCYLLIVSIRRLLLVGDSSTGMAEPARCPCDPLAPSQCLPCPFVWAWQTNRHCFGPVIKHSKHVVRRDASARARWSSQRAAPIETSGERMIVEMHGRFARAHSGSGAFRHPRRKGLGAGGAPPRSEHAPVGGDRRGCEGRGQPRANRLSSRGRTTGLISVDCNTSRKDRTSYTRTYYGTSYTRTYY